jgi:hypothetical protein
MAETPMAMAVMATEAKDRAEPKDDSTAEAMTEPAVSLLNHRRGLYLLCQACNGSRHRRTRRQPQAKRASDNSEQCCLPHICLLRLLVRRAGSGPTHIPPTACVGSLCN